MKLFQTSGPALFMYTVILCTLILSTVCFYVYYCSIVTSEIVLWVAITAFTIMYHLWGRIILGNFTKLFKRFISHKSWWFREKKFEKRLYEILRVKEWKHKALTYNPEQFSLKENSIDKVLYTMTKAELDHWMNELISISTMFFGMIWGKTELFVITAILAMIFDAQFIVIQRFNRPRVLRVLEKTEEKPKEVEQPKSYKDIINKKK